MQNPEKAEWYAAGTVMNEKLVCQHSSRFISSGGILRGQNPFQYTVPVLLAQMVLIFVVTRATHLLLQPLRQTMVVSQILAGILIGPSFLAQNKVFVKDIFPEGSRLVLRTFAEFGLVLYTFTFGVRTDIGLLKNVGRRDVVIGLSGTMVSIVFGGSTYMMIQQINPLDSASGLFAARSVPMNAMTSFMVILILLTDLNILNSDLGRLASSVSMVSDSFCWVMAFVMINIGEAIGESSSKPLFTIPVVFIYYVILFFILRPLVLWIVSRSEQRKNITENQFFSIICVAIGVAFVGEYIGQHAAFGTFIFGLSLPPGPPLGSHLLSKLDIVASGLLLPLFCTVCGLRTDIHSLAHMSSLKMELIIIMGYIGKFAGTILSSLYFHIPYQEALSLGLIMCCRGIFDLAIFSLCKDKQVLNNQMFALLIINMLIVTAIATPVVVSLYDPASRYTTSTRRAIITTQENLALRMLVCIHREENVHPMINLLEASNPTRSSPISVFVLQLVELRGHSVAILQPHKTKRTGFDVTCSGRVVNAFDKFEQRANRNALVQHFTAIAPFASMQNDICTVALDKKVDIVIVPFHKIWGIDGKPDACFNQLRTVNGNVLKMAPCSVGVLVDRSQTRGERSVYRSESLFNIALLFLGGADDAEALAYSKRMAEHPNVSLTVVCFRARHSNEHKNEKKKKDYESDVMKRVRNKSIESKIIYKEEVVKDGNDTTQVIQMMEDDFDLVIVGKHHDPNSPVTLGLTDWRDWSESPELGIIGDVLASSDYRFSVLVVQQQPLETGSQ